MLADSVKKYKVAVIGCGRVAWLLEHDPLEKKPCTHAGGYLGLDNVEIVAGADTDQDKLDAFSRQYGVSAVYTDYREMLDRERPDIVSVCAYATERSEMVREAIGAGVRGIWCEKAFATSLKEADDTVALCEKSGVSLIVSHMRRWSPDYCKVKEIIQEGGIGRILSVSTNFSGSFLHTGTHAFDVLRWLFGEVEWVAGRLEANTGEFLWESAEDLGGMAALAFEGGIWASVHAETRPYFLFEFDIFGTGGRIRIGNNEVLELYKPGPSRHYTGVDELLKEEFPPIEDKNIWIGAASSLLGLMEGGKENPNGPHDGRAALEIALAIHRSDARGGDRVNLPLEDREFSVKSR